MASQNFVEMHFFWSNFDRKRVGLLIQSTLLTETISSFQSTNNQILMVWSSQALFWNSKLVGRGWKKHATLAFVNEKQIVILIILFLQNEPLGCYNFNKEDLKILYHISGDSAKFRNISDQKVYFLFTDWELSFFYYIFRTVP
jgi:hypothetical protein